MEEVKGQEIICRAQNNAELDGLLTVLHQDRVEEGISSTLDMPLLSQHDVEALLKISAEFEVRSIRPEQTSIDLGSCA